MYLAFPVGPVCLVLVFLLCDGCSVSLLPAQVERVPAVRRGHAAGHLPHVHLPQEAAAPTQEEEEEEKGEHGRPVQRRRRPQGEEQQRQEPGGQLVHGLRERHQR